MIRPRTLLVLVDCFQQAFSPLTNVGGGMVHVTHWDWLHDFFFAREYPEQLTNYATLADDRMKIKALILGMRPEGEVIAMLTHGQRAPDADDVSERLLRRVAEDMLSYGADAETLVKPLKSTLRKLEASLALDGYEVRGGRVVQREENVFDVQEEAAGLAGLYKKMQLEQPEQLEHDLKLTDEHYTNGHWGDCIKHARDVLEHTLLGVARARSKALGKNLARSALPGVVRSFLRDNQVISDQEEKFLFALHTLLSIEGGHANMSEAEEARIERQYALTAAHFALLRWESLVGHAGDPG
jgi:hypothetical protein